MSLSDVIMEIILNRGAIEEREHMPHGVREVQYRYVCRDLTNLTTQIALILLLETFVVSQKA